MGDRMVGIRFAHVVPGNRHPLGSRQVVVCSDSSSRFHQGQGRRILGRCGEYHPDQCYDYCICDFHNVFIVVKLYDSS